MIGASIIGLAPIYQGLQEDVQRIDGAPAVSSAE
jgi:hypothetical protein